jgi:hypothetical protein
MSFLKGFFRQARQPVIVVSGLPRSGTSMMMKMLEAGGIPALTDNLRTADEDNPRGYYEFEAVKKLREGDFSWAAQAEGKAVKVISGLLTYLPPEYPYQVLFMLRAMPEILASQRKMLVRRGEDPNKISDSEMAQTFEKHLDQVTTWLDAQKNIQSLYVDYNRLLCEPQPVVQQIGRLLGGKVSSAAMLSAIDPNLYRNKA